MDAEKLPVGKLRPELLARFLEKYTSKDPRVLVGAQIGEDAAVIDFGDTYLVAKTDPITFAPSDIGTYTIIINANDIATRGARPKWFLGTLLLPEGKTTEALVEEIFSQLSQACKKFGIAYCGGHTEITYGIDRPLVVGQMLGEVDKDRLITTSGAQIGDDLLLTKGIAIEATSIIARAKREEILTKYASGFLEKCLNYLYHPGISVVEEALLATQLGQVHAMHDPTEGGLATGLYELAQAAGVGLRIYWDQIPILPESKVLCQAYQLDPLGVIASGALLIATAPEDTEKIVEGLHRAGIRTSVIGRVVARQEGIKLNQANAQRDLPSFERDEIMKIFEE